MWIRLLIPTPSTEYIDIGSIQSHQPSQPYLVPSWSQLCKGVYTQSLGYYSSTCRRHRAEVDRIEPDIKLAGANRFGAIKSATLTVQSFVMSLGSTSTISVVSMTLSRDCDPAWTTDWRLTVKRDEDLLGCCGVDLDHHVREMDALEYIRQSKLVLLGSCTLRPAGEDESDYLYDNSDIQGSEQRYPYGILVHRSQEDQSWYRVGTFRPERPEKLAPTISLEIFKEASRTESLKLI